MYEEAIRPCPVEMNPVDAQEPDLEDGEQVCVISRRGKIKAPVKIH